MEHSDFMQLSVWTGKSEELLAKIRKLFEDINYPEDDVPNTVYDDGKPISMVFAGQFSAGKSTIIKALTKNPEIEIGAGIKTQHTHSYDWNGIEVVDTPGIDTTLRPDHDEIAYDAIAKADVLVYVVTQELFDDFIGKDFRKLLLEKDKAGEMILVVNKMEDIGNTPENQQIKKDDLLKVTEPYTPEQLRTVFIDAESYLDSLDEEDKEVAEELRLRSNYDGLVDTLNKFVNDKGMSAKLTTVLYRIFELLQKAIPKYQSSTGDTDVDMLEEHALRERHIISDASWRVESSVKSIYENAASDIRAKGAEVANTVFDCKSEEEANDLIEAAYKEVDKISEDCANAITKKIQDLTEDCEAQLDEFYHSDFSSNLQFRLKEKKDKGNPILNQFLKSDVIAQGSTKIISSTTGANAAANGLRAFSGSSAQQWVLNIGHFFGHKFRPWEAVKWVQKINVAGKALGIFGVVFTWGMQAKEDIDNEKKRIEQRESREKLRAGFNDAANEVRKYFNNALNNYLNENYRARINELDAQVAEIRSMRKDRSDACKRLEEAQDECRYLISDIHKDYNSAEIDEVAAGAE